MSRHSSVAVAGEHLGSTAGQDAGEQHLAARFLLRRPILTLERDRDELILVRRHGAALTAMFAAELGYDLHVEQTFARLVKANPSPQAPSRPVRYGRDDIVLAPTGYTYLCLICAALLAPGQPPEISALALLAAVRADAAEQNIALTQGRSDRRHVAAALQVLQTWGVLTERPGPAFAVNQALLVRLLPQVGSPAPETVPVRQSLLRRLVEDPVVFKADLTSDEATLLIRERNDLARSLEENFGLVLEARAEGALAYDATGRLTDLDFPGTGSTKQAALLLLDELLARAEEQGVDPESFVIVDGKSRPGIVIEWTLVDEILTALRDEHQSTWKNDYIDSIDALRIDAVAVLLGVGLVQSLAEGIVLFPFGARYRSDADQRGSR